MTSEEMTLEKATEIIGAHQQRERERKNTELRKLIGRYFKTRNSYGSEGDWWLYGTVTEVTEYGHLRGWHFQRKLDRSHDDHEFSDHTSMITVHSWTEISREEFVEAGKQFQADLAQKFESYLG